ncbi:hypothetical protein PVL29_002629 [Vitis rotundifolia]|uniref:Uncharacterized protein n=1 Tax=Vitis rotundifolia TaxID=103349 RepID=A0AA39AI66_VITRO|nr:hypothetical protein PVL29_002629 [Vitis rotundifolia]
MNRIRSSQRPPTKSTDFNSDPEIKMIPNSTQISDTFLPTNQIPEKKLRQQFFQPRNLRSKQSLIITSPPSPIQLMQGGIGIRSATNRRPPRAAGAAGAAKSVPDLHQAN